MVGFGEDPLEGSDLDIATRLQDRLVARATGGEFDGGGPAYRDLRRHFNDRADTRAKLPEFVRRYSDPDQFWNFIQPKFPSYRERRTYLWDEFRPLLGYLEAQDRSPGIAPISETLEVFDPDRVHAVWQKALDRRNADPDGAITAARALVETVCKHILDDSGTPYDGASDLPKLWALTSEVLNLAPPPASGGGLQGHPGKLSGRGEQLGHRPEPGR